MPRPNGHAAPREVAAHTTGLEQRDAPATARRRVDTATRHAHVVYVKSQVRARKQLPAVGKLDNRPLFRGLHGLALALWRLRRFDAAELALLNMLWLNPVDNQGARMLLADVRARRRWEDTDHDA